MPKSYRYTGKVNHSKMRPKRGQKFYSFKLGGPSGQNPIVKKAIRRANKTQRKVAKKNRQLWRPSFVPATCIIKNSTLTGWNNQAIHGLNPSGEAKPWELIRPLNMNRSATDYAGVARTTNAIWARNIRYDIEVLPQQANLTGFQLRVVHGYFKGDSNVATQGFTSSNMATLYPTINARLQDREVQGKSDFYFKFKKTITVTPEQIYDSNGSDDAAMTDEPMRALYKPRRIYANFNLNRKITYENSDGDSQDGWLPFIAIQCIQLPGTPALTRPAIPSQDNHGVNPTPRLTLRCSTYFSDIH